MSEETPEEKKRRLEEELKQIEEEEREEEEAREKRKEKQKKEDEEEEEEEKKEKLKEREEALTKREKEVSDREAAVKKKEEELNAKEKELAHREAELKKREEAHKSSEGHKVEAKPKETKSTAVASQSQPKPSAPKEEEKKKSPETEKPELPKADLPPVTTEAPKEGSTDASLRKGLNRRASVKLLEKASFFEQAEQENSKTKTSNVVVEDRAADMKALKSVFDTTNGGSVASEENSENKEDQPKKSLGGRARGFATWSASKFKSMGLGNEAQKCHECSKTVYLTEKISADNVIFHKGCFKCTHCSAPLVLGNYASLNGKYYCKPHFKQLFALKGNYTEGFAEQQTKDPSQSKEPSQAVVEEKTTNS